MRVRKKRQWRFEPFDPSAFRAEFDSIYKEERPMKCQVGDWIRFEKCDQVFLAEVKYRVKHPIDVDVTLYTTEAGTATEDQVLERRVKPKE